MQVRMVAGELGRRTLDAVSRNELPFRLRALAAWVLRVVLVLLTLQVGGVIHGAADVLAAAGMLDEEHEQCPPGDPCDDCPAGCPSCHCGAALRTVAPERGFALAPVDDVASLMLGVSSASSGPLGPILPSVYRPPRSVVFAVVVS
jgi:hypothetical protein